MEHLGPYISALLRENQLKWRHVLHPVEQTQASPYQFLTISQDIETPKIKITRRRVFILDAERCTFIRYRLMQEVNDLSCCSLAVDRNHDSTKQAVKLNLAAPNLE